MDKIRIAGGRRLEGAIEVSGAKNAALPLMCAALLTDQPVELHRTPDLADVSSMRRLLQLLGVEATHPPGEPDALRLTCKDVLSTTAPYEIVRKMRASVLTLGPMLAREGRAEVSLPGGCAIGARPIDLHLAGLEAMGATIDLEDGYVRARVDGRLKGADIHMKKVSVGATENLLMAACLADGETILRDAAREPEIEDLADLLRAMGAEIEGAGESVVRIRGVERLSGASHEVVADRIEAGTYAMAAAITGGDVELRGAKLEHLSEAGERLREAGVAIEEREGGVRVSRDGPLRGVDVMTRPYPGFATDLQAQYMALMSVAEGAAMITETIFENRFMHVPELARMGANVTVHGATALVRGQEGLKGAPVMATDLRASVCLVLAGLAAEGETTVQRIYHLDRGYERLERKLQSLGAEVERLQ